MLSYVAEMSKYVATANTEFKMYHGDGRRFARFLVSTLDEVRLRRADDCAQFITEIVDGKEFRDLYLTVLRREASCAMSHPRQRDHSAHVVNNYLLGWYLYEKCPVLKQALVKAFKRRYIYAKDFKWRFGNLWLFVSLLHDIGYIFEGEIGPLDAAVTNPQVDIGVASVNDFFDNRFWQTCHIYLREEKQALLNLAGQSLPPLGRSLPGIAACCRAPQ
jgi:hypothetical protein